MKNLDEILVCLRSDNETLALAALKYFYEILHRKLLKTATTFLKSRVEAEDLVHDFFLTLWKKRREYHSVRSVENYFIVVIRRSALRHVRQMRDRWEEEHAYGKKVESVSNADFECLDAGHDEKQSLLVHAIARLPSQQRQAIILSYFDGLGNEEIRKRMGLARSTVGHYLTFGRKGIKAYLRKKGF